MKDHTPTPWYRDGWHIIGADGSIVCRIVPWDESGCNDEDHANADLIVAAVNAMAKEVAEECQGLVGACLRIHRGVHEDATSLCEVR